MFILSIGLLMLLQLRSYLNSMINLIIFFFIQLNLAEGDKLKNIAYLQCYKSLFLDTQEQNNKSHLSSLCYFIEFNFICKFALIISHWLDYSH
jgi:hypothetical protein